MLVSKAVKVKKQNAIFDVLGSVVEFIFYNPI